VFIVFYVFFFVCTFLGGDLRALSTKKEVDPWAYYIRQNRERHHLSLFAGISSINWDGILPNKYSFSYREVSISQVLSYSFYVSLSEHWSYFLGSSLGLHSRQTKANKVLYDYWLLPGLHLGIAYAYNEHHRYSVHIGYALARLNSFAYSYQNIVQSITITARRHLIALHYEKFFLLKWAFVLLIEQGWFIYSPPFNADTTPLDIKLTHTQTMIGVGVTYHAL